MTLLIVYILLAIGVSFLCSLLEAALLSITTSQIAILVDKQKSHGHVLKEQKESINRPLAAILTLNTIAHTIGAAGVGAQVASIFGNRWVVMASVLLTFLILFLSEIIPKTIGAVYCNELARLTAYGTKALVLLTYPLVVIVEFVAGKIGKQTQAVISREEVEAISKIASQHGTITADESKLIKNLLFLRKITTEQIMTPLNVVFTFPANMPIKAVVEEHKILPFSRIPVIDDQIGNIIGVVLRFKILLAFRDQKGDEPVSSLTQPVGFVDENLDVAQLLNQFIEKSEHFFVVRKDSKVCGIVTLEDALETLLGVEIVDETDTVVDMRELAQRISKRREHRE